VATSPSFRTGKRVEALGQAVQLPLLGKSTPSPKLVSGLAKMEEVLAYPWWRSSDRRNLSLNLPAASNASSVPHLRKRPAAPL
jgi:hypothetical protein